MPATIIKEELQDKHLQEWLASGVSEDIIRLNVETITDPKSIDSLLGWKSKSRWKASWSNGGGWIVSGDDLGRDLAFAGLQFKPDTPRLNGQDKPIKYESPLKGKEEFVEPLFLRVPDHLWEAIAQFWQVPIDPSEYEKGFWHWVETHPQIPICYTEGGKKAGAGITALLPTISIPGVSNGQWHGRLNPLLKPFTTVGRSVYIAFDSDLHHKHDVRRELDRFSRLVAKEGAVPELLIWDYSEETKGMDDLIAAKGHDYFRDLISQAKTFEEYRKEEIEILDREEPEIAIAEHFNQIACKALYSDCQYVCINDVLHKWTGTHYEPSSDAVEKRRISEFCNKFLIYDERIRKRVYKYANENSVNAVLRWVKVACGIDPATVNPTGLNLANGILTIEWQGKKPKWTLRKHHPEIVYTHVSKVSYDPKADPEPCDRLLVALDAEQRDVFLKTIAASLDLLNVRKVLPDRLRALILKGDGSNGKDSLREAIYEIFVQGLTGCSFRDFQQYDEGRKFPVAKLAHSRINWASENHSNLRLDTLQVLKNIITGDPIDIEPKSQDEYTIKPACVLFLNCNEAPNILGAQKAIASRYAILKFSKTFTSNPTEPDELLADPRFKDDPDFLRTHVCPSLLNRILDALAQLMVDGINYKPLDGAIDEVRQESCHLLKWTDDIGLAYGNGRIKIGDLYDSLKDWYVASGTLEIETTDKGKEKLVWLDEGNRYDPVVKAPRLMRQTLAKIFPKAKFSQRTEDGFFILGVQSEKFANAPNFYSFASSEEKEQEIASISAMNQSMNQADFGTENMNQNVIADGMNQNAIHEANQNGHEPNKSLRDNGSEAKNQNEPNFETYKTQSPETYKKIDIAIGATCAAKVDNVLVLDCTIVKDLGGKYNKRNGRLNAAYKIRQHDGKYKTVFEEDIQCYTQAADGEDLLELLGVVTKEVSTHA